MSTPFFSFSLYHFRDVVAYLHISHFRYRKFFSGNQSQFIPFNLCHIVAVHKIASVQPVKADVYKRQEQKWGAAQNYDLCLNVSQWGTDGSVELILRALRQVYLDLC